MFGLMLCRTDGAHWSFNMKKLVLAAILAMAVATPALAKQRLTVSQQAAAAQAYVPDDGSPYSVDRYTVIVNGRIVGRDPDPSIRLMLMRDPINDGS